MLRAVLPPLIAAYATFVAMVILARRRPAPRPRGIGNGAIRAGRAGVVTTIVGGYVAFLAIVVIFHVWLAGEGDAFADAVWGGAFLSGITVVVTLGSSLLGRRRRAS